MTRKNSIRIGPFLCINTPSATLNLNLNDTVKLSDEVDELLLQEGPNRSFGTTRRFIYYKTRPAEIYTSRLSRYLDTRIPSSSSQQGKNKD